MMKSEVQKLFFRKKKNSEAKSEVQLQPPDSQKLTDSAPLLGNHTNSPSSASSDSTVAENCDEIKTVDLENDTSSAPCCRICLEEDSELISPCMCKGTQQFVHRSCLDHWRSIKEGFGFSRCTICKAQYHLRVETFDDGVEAFDDDDNNSWHRRAKSVARDVLLFFFAVQSVIAVLAGFVYMMDKDGEFRNSFNDEFPILSKHPIRFYYCTGVVSLYVLTAIFGMCCPRLN